MLLKELLVRLPESVQNWLIARAMRSGRVLDTPVFGMLMRTLEFYGGDVAEIEAVCRAAGRGRTIKDAVTEAWLAKITQGNQAFDRGDADEARQRYLDACMYFFLLEYFTDDLEESRRRYEVFMPMYERFATLAEPTIRRVSLPYAGGEVKAQFRLPQTNGVLPAVIFLQGNEGVKEHMLSFEGCALRQGMATLSMDPPGYGETLFTGLTWNDERDFRSAVALAVDFLLETGRVRSDAIGIFGVSGGGLTSHYAASLETRIAASAGLGATSPHTFVESWRFALASQKKKSFRYTGTDNLRDCEAWMRRLQKEILRSLPRLAVPNLWVSGTEDTLVPVGDIRRVTEELGAHSELWPIPGGDHLCSQFLADGLADQIFDWLADKLQTGNRI